MTMSAYTIPQVIERFKIYHEQYPAWGSLHVVLDDLNIEDSHVQGSLSWALENNDTEGAQLAVILLKMSRTQRRKLAHMA